MDRSTCFLVDQVLFKRVLGDVTFCQVAIFFTMIGLCSTLMFWPIALTLALTHLGMYCTSYDTYYPLINPSQS